MHFDNCRKVPRIHRDKWFLCPQPKSNGWNRNARTFRQPSRKAAGKFTGKVVRPNCLVYVRPLCHSRIAALGIKRKGVQK